MDLVFVTCQFDILKSQTIMAFEISELKISQTSRMIDRVVKLNFKNNYQLIFGLYWIQFLLLQKIAWRW